MRKIYNISILYALIFVFQTNAQVLKYETELGVHVSTNKQLPFWIHSNRYGEMPLQSSPFVLGRMGVQKSYATDSLRNYKNKWIDWRAGLNGVGNLSSSPTIVFSEVFVNGRLGQIEIGVGRRKENIGIVDDELSSGNYSFSTNALPMPKIFVSSINYIDMPYTKKLVAFKFHYADGYRGPSHGGKYGLNYIYPDTYLHHKSFYGRLGKPTWRWNFFAGFCHQAIWGSENVYTNGGFPYDFWRTYRGVILGESWYSSRIGNHVANVDIGFSHTNEKRKIMFYRQSFVEDGTLYRDIMAIVDGLTGVNVAFKGLKWRNIDIYKITAEYFSTYNQGINARVNAAFGVDDFFNHYLYQDGWSYKGRTLGTPLIAPNTVLNKDIVKKEGFTSNNRMAVVHLGLQGVVYQKYDFMLKTSFSRNAGTYNYPLAPQRWQFSGILELKTKLQKVKNTEVLGMMATDLGGVYPNNLGFYVALRKTGILQKRENVY